METNKQVGLSQKKYLQPGTYLWKFKQQFLCCGVANLLTTTLLAPLQRWRIISQTQKFYPLRPNKFKNFLDYIKRIPKEQGFLALWRGNNAAIWIYLYQTIFQIGMFDTLKHLNKQINEQTSQVPQLSYFFDNLLFPLFASMMALGVIHPLDTFRIHRSMSLHSKQSEALFTKFRHRRIQIGLRSMYNGFILANLISVINFNLYKNLFTLFDQSSLNLSSSESNQPKIQILSKQLIFSIMAVALVHPLDTFKKIYQLNNMSKPVMFHGYKGVYRYLNQNKLNSALWNGMGVSVVRTLIFAPVYWGIIEVWKSQLGRSERRKIQ